MDKKTWTSLVLAGVLLAACGSDAPQAEGRQEAAPASPPRAPENAEAVAQQASPPDEPEEILSVLSVERQVDLLARREGMVEKILRDQGDRVEQGAELARLDDREIRAQLEKARANLEVAQNNVKYNEAEVKAKRAAFRRARQMNELGLNSEADLEEAEFRFRGAEYDLASWKAAVKRNEAEVRLLELELEKARIRAPFTGVVSRRYIRPGQTVVKDDRCFRLSQLAPLQVQFLVPEISPVQPRRGHLVNVVPVADSQRVYMARIVKVSPTVDAASGSYDVTARLTEPDLDALRPGMSVRVLWGKPVKPAE